MALDGSGFHVELDVLDEAAQGIKRSVQDQDNSELADLCGDSEQYGHDNLTDALDEFCSRWSDILDDLIDEGEDVANALTDVANTYRDLDADAVRTLRGDPAVDAADG